MRQILDRVTITGADDNTDIDELIHINRKYPWVEWGFLLSANRSGGPRFPSLEWLSTLQKRIEYSRSISASGHLCGKWVRDICKGDWAFTHELPVWRMFQRLQLNFHSYVHHIKDELAFLQGFDAVHPFAEQFIFQLDNVNNKIVDVAIDNGINACPFFDTSGGIGSLPKRWQSAREGVYTGYAGGLSPENVAEQLGNIETVCGEGPIWIDVETHVRSPDNQHLDMRKVEAFLEASKPWVKQ